MDSLAELQNMVLDYCKTQVNETTFKCWFSDIKLQSIDGNNVVLIVSNDFKRKIISENYMSYLKDAFLQILSIDVNIQINCEENYTPIVAANNDAGYEYTFDTFIVGDSNKYAHAASLAVAENPKIIYNPLFIYGQPGLGKTHLLNAIAAKLKERDPNKKIVTVTCETFVNEFIYAVGHKSVYSFREKYREADVLLLDDIQFISGKVESEVEFFNTFDTLYRSQRQIVVTSDRPPKDIRSLSERMRSRFEQGLVTDIQPPEFETRVAIIKRKAELLQMDIPDNVCY
ncbi:MAG: chromosomal replication initiator protein DnaA, partial [Acutalibacteraceae bacterium]